MREKRTYEEIKEIAESFKKRILVEKDEKEKIIFQAILTLIEKSEYGKKSAEVVIVLPSLPGHGISEVGFYNWVKQGPDVIGPIFEGRGDVLMESYTNGLKPKSATLKFKKFEEEEN